MTHAHAVQPLAPSHYPLARGAFFKNPFVGLYAKASETHAFVAQNTADKLRATIRETLAVEVHPVLLCNSNLVGLFLALNSNGVVLPKSAEGQEVRAFKKLGLNVATLPDTFGAVSNNILVNDVAALVNPDLEKHDAKRVADALDVEVFAQPVAGLKTVGAANVVTHTGLLAFNDITDIELKLLERVFRVKTAARGTTNLGSPFNGLGLIANSHGALIGELTTGYELERVYAALAHD